MIQVAKHRANNPVRLSKDGDAPSDCDIIEEWVREMWDNSTDQTLTRKLLRIFQAEFPEESDDLVVHFNNTYGHIRNILGCDTDIELPRIMGESHQPGSTKVDLTYLLTSLRLMQQWPHYHEIWSSITPTEMDNVLFPSYFRSRKSWTRSITTGEDFNPNDISEKSRNAVFLNLQQVTDAAIRPTEKQMRMYLLE